MFFMGQEWGARSPFHYFTNMPEELGVKITEGRKREFIEMKVVAKPSELESMTNPQDEKSFVESKLAWAEIQKDEHRRLLELYRAGLKLRRELFGGVNPSRDQWRIEAVETGVIIHYQLPKRAVSVFLRLKPSEGTVPAQSTVLLRSNAEEFSASSENDGPETLVYVS